MLKMKAKRLSFVERSVSFGRLWLVGQPRPDYVNVSVTSTIKQVRLMCSDNLNQAADEVVKVII